MPDIRLARLEGGDGSLLELTQSGPVVLALYKVSCPVCQLALPYLQRIHSTALPVYAISQNDAEDTTAFNQRFGLTLPTLLDSEDSQFPASNAFGISSVPTIFVAEHGSIKQVIEGWRKKEMEHLALRSGVTLFQTQDSVPEWKAG